MFDFNPSLRQIMLVFLQIGVSSFGGAIPWARRYLVEKRGWVSERQFTDILTICQTVPGPNIVNIAVYYGYKCRGVAGAFTAFFSLLCLPFFFTIGLSLLVKNTMHLPEVKSALMGLTCAAVGFMFATGAKLARPFSKNGVAVLVCGATIGLGIGLQWSLPIILVVAGSAAIFLSAKGKL